MPAANTPFELRPRFVGRNAELEHLDKSFLGVLEKRALVFMTIVGSPGAGKTRLVRELARGIQHRNPEVRFLLANAGGPTALPYSGFVRLLSARFGITATDSADAAREKITSGVADVLPATKVTEVAHLLSHLLRVPFPQSPVVEPLAESPQQLETRTFIAVKRFLSADADRGALILCLDELERAGTETVNLLHYLAAGLASSPVMLIGISRPNLNEVHPSFGDGEAPVFRLDLGPLGHQEAEELVRELLKPVRGVPEWLVKHAERLGGMPRTLIELVRYLVEAEVIASGGPLAAPPPPPPGAVDKPPSAPPMAWTLDRVRLSRLRLPEKHEEILAQRLGQMPAEERHLLEKAAACGEMFWLDAVVALGRASQPGMDPDGPSLAEIAAAGDRSRQHAADVLARLAQREWILESQGSQVPGEREFRFAYPPLRDVVYEGIEKNARQRYHRLVAQWVELGPEGRREGEQEEIGRHLELAGDGEAAALRYRRAADAARARYFNDKAIRLYAHTLACLGEGDIAARIHLWHDLGSVYELKGDFEAALGAFERMLRLTWVVASRVKAAVAFNKIGRVYRRKGDPRLALDYLVRAQELFEQAGDDRGVTGSLADIGHVLWLLGRYDEAFEKITRSLNKRGQLGDKRSIAASLSDLGNIQKDRGKLAEAENCHREALELRRQIGDRAGVVLSLNNVAVLRFERGDLEGARRGWEQALSEAEEIGALPLQALALNNLGELALVEKKYEESRRRLEETVALCREIDDRRLLSEATRNLGLLELDEGNAKSAQDLVRKSLEMAEASGFRDYVGRALLALGEVHAATLFDENEEGTKPSPVSPAEEYFQKGVEVFRELGNESELAKGLERFGRFKLERGDVRHGRGLLEEAQKIFQKLGMMAGEDVKRVIRELQ